MFIPKDFDPPTLIKDGYIARKLMARDVYLDYIAVMSSIDIIRKTRGGSGAWPSPDLTFEDDLIDLAWHQREFEARSSFAYTVMNTDETKCLGCIYFYPPNTGMSDAASGQDSDVDISWWVTQEAYDLGFYETLSFDIKQWVQEAWPFKNVFWANETLPAGF